jgi:hypothetical protein
MPGGPLARNHRRHRSRRRAQTGAVVVFSQKRSEVKLMAYNHSQVLDKLLVEQQRGITVKAQTASLFYPYKGKTYLLNLIDTPGHVDFSYEVSSSLAACEGTLLVVDAAQGVQAQTLANFYLAFERDLTVVPGCGERWCGRWFTNIFFFFFFVAAGVSAEQDRHAECADSRSVA